MENNEMGKNVHPWDLWLGPGEQENGATLYNTYITMYCLKFYNEDNTF